MTIVLVSCAKRKHDAPVMARELYLGRLFAASRRYAERYGDYWFILSAKYGLVAPETVISPYDVALRDRTPEQRRQWGERVAAGVIDVAGGPGDCVTILAGRMYVNAIAPRLEARGIQVYTPLAGKGNGARYQWLVRDYAEAPR